MDGVNPCAPINPYGASKWMVERVLADYRTTYGFGSFALRYFNAAGADPAGGIGELRDLETHLIPRAMMALQGHVPRLRGVRRRLRDAGRDGDPSAARTTLNFRPAYSDLATIIRTAAWAWHKKAHPLKTGGLR
jgi:UDP-glucose 4-epimerase